MNDSELIRSEEAKREAVLRRDPVRYWREVNAWLNKMEASLPPEQRKDTPAACKARERRLLAYFEKHGTGGRAE